MLEATKMHLLQILLNMDKVLHILVLKIQLFLLPLRLGELRYCDFAYFLFLTILTNAVISI